MADKFVKYDFKELESFAKELKKRRFVKLGVFGKNNTKHSDTKQTNAQIGFIHEFGSPMRNIPVRSFLRFPIQKKFKEIRKMIASKFSKVDFGTLYDLLAIKGEAVIQEAFDTQGFGQWAKPKYRKGSPLIDTGELRQSISSEVVSGK